MNRDSLQRVVDALESGGYLARSDELNPWGVVAAGGPSIHIAAAGNDVLYLSNLLRLPFPRDAELAAADRLAYGDSELLSAWDAIRGLVISLIPAEAGSPVHVRFVEGTYAQDEDVRWSRRPHPG